MMMMMMIIIIITTATTTTTTIIIIIIMGHKINQFPVIRVPYPGPWETINCFGPSTTPTILITNFNSE